MFPTKRFDTMFLPDRCGCSKGLDMFNFFYKNSDQHYLYVTIDILIHTFHESEQVHRVL